MYLFVYTRQLLATGDPRSSRLIHYVTRQNENCWLLDSHEFNTYVRKFKKKYQNSDINLENLRNKTQHKMENPDETYTISAELPMGSRVILVSSDKSRQSGHLSSQETRHFTVTLDPGSAIPGVGDQFRIYIFSRTGVFSFPSQITKTLDLSASGVYCKVEKEIPLLSRIKITLVIPAGAKNTSSQQKNLTIATEGVVVREHPVIVDGKFMHYDVAIFFDQISQKDKQHILDYTSSQITKKP